MDIFKLFGTIAINNGDANKSIDDTSSKATALAESAKKAFSTVGAVVVKGVAAGTAAVSTLVAGSVKQYAEYEQLVGGVNTLFEDLSWDVQQNASKAFQTAGLSANEYMSTVMSFSASLNQSLMATEGDISRAAELADMAIIDMADNANKMGTGIESIQDAYQGFAKQNYTMLDNLKLGYGGTKTEMQRLLKDAQKLTGKKYNLKNLSDVYEAIHVIQTEMGITGTTALEASETISGSWSAMGAAWTNLIVGIADDSQNLDGLIKNFADSAVTMFGNVAARVPHIVSGINQLVAGIVPMLPGIIEDFLPVILEGVIGLFGSLASALPGIAQVLFDTFSNLVAGIDFQALGATLGNMFVSFANDLPSMLQNIGNAISNGWSTIVWPMIQGLFKAVFGVELPEWSVIADNIDKLWVDVQKDIAALFKTVFGVELPAWSDVTSGIKTLWETVKTNTAKTFQAVFSVFTSDDSANEKGKKIWDVIIDWWAGVVTSIGDIFFSFFGIRTKDTDENGNTIWANIVNWWYGVVKSVGDIFFDIFRILTSDDDDKGGKVWDVIKNWWTGVLASVGDIFKQVFGIELPSIEEIRQKIKDWWAGVVSGIKLSLGISTEDVHTPTYISGSGTANKGKGGAGNLGNTVVTMNAAGAVFDAPTLFDTRLGYQMVGEAGPEAVAPISVLRGYIREEVEAATRNDGGMKEEFREFANALPDMLVNAFASMKFDVNNREFARLVKAVN